MSKPTWRERRIMRRVRKMLGRAERCPRCGTRWFWRDPKYPSSSWGFVHYICRKGHSWCVDEGDNFGM